MPLNEAAGYTRSNLNKEQKRQAEAAIFGLQETAMSDFTAEEIERMRAAILKHDQAGKIVEFDLNNPPKVPYVHQEFPRMIYHHATRKHKIVQNDAELQSHLERGWDTKPFPSEPPEEPELSPEDAAEAASIDAQIRARRKRQ